MILRYFISIEVSTADLQKLGFKIVFFPLTALMATTQVMSACFQHLKAQGTTTNFHGLMKFRDFQELMGVTQCLQFEQKYQE